MRVDENLYTKEKLIRQRKSAIKNAKKVMEHEKFLAYGEFDRIGFEKIVKFSRFRDISDKSKIWIGDRQTLLVYDIPEDEYRDGVFYEAGNFYVRENDKLVRSEHLFLGITILQFKDSQKENRAQMNDYLCSCKKSILKFVSEEKPEIKCSVLGTLGSFGLIILWLSDQYTDILNMVTKIRNTDVGNEAIPSNKSVFLSAYTIFAQNHCYGVGWEKKIDEIKGEAALRLTLKRGVSADILAFLRKWQLDKTEIYHSAGEHDVTIRMKSSDAFNLFSNGNELDSKGEFVKKNVLQSNLLLCEDIKESGDKEFSVPKEEEPRVEGCEKRKTEEALPELEDIQTEYQKLRDRVKYYFPNTAGMADTLDWLYSDYIAKISTASNEMWISNFSHQFLTILRCLETFLEQLKDLDIYKKDALQIINDLLSDFERQISHIAESNNLILGTPICQFRYLGQNNITLYSYFGIIKTILDFIYEQQEVSNQAEIVPLIVADITPIIKSNLFIECKNKNDARVVTINLPMMALYDPVCYYPYLLHEIFHYVVPKDRFIRNELLGCLISVEMMNSLCKSILILDLNLKTNREKEQLNLVFKDCILPYIYSFTLDYYDKYEQYEYGNNETYSDVDKRTLTAEKYEKAMFDKWLSWFNADESIDINNNPVYLYFCLLYSDKKTIYDKLEKWKEKRLVMGEDFGVCVAGIIQFIESLGGIVDNQVLETQKSNFAEVMSHVGEDVFESTVFLMDSIKEGLVDIDMATIGKMEFAEYLLQFTKIRKELLLNCTDGGADIQNSIRIGMVLDFLCSEKGGEDLTGFLENSKKAFVDMYCGLYYNIHKVDEDKKYVDKLILEAEQWFAYWRICIQKYMLLYRVYAVFFKALQEQSLLSGKGNAVDMGGSIYWKRYTEMLKEYGNYIQNHDEILDAEQWKEKKTFIDDQLFNLNIDFIHKFQYQKSFVELNIKRKKRIKEVGAMPYVNHDYSYEIFKQLRILFLSNKSVRRQYCWKYDVSDVGQIGNITADIAEELKRCSNRLLGRNEHPIWYRGQQSVEYKLVPSIMRKYKYQKTKQKESDSFSLLNLMKREYEEFRFRADGAQEAVERVGYTEADYIALMQHYSVPSNFLDWTEDALSALYFALESFMDEKVEKTDKDAALYIFSPALYNHARKKMILRADKDKRQLELEKEVVRTVQEGIPNMTVSFNQGKYDMFLLGKEEYADDNSAPYSSSEERDKKLAFYLPIAIYIARLNKRIQSQHGIFLAYNIYTSPDTEDKFDYIALEEIQEFYFKLFANEKETCPFLYKIAIEKGAREKIAAWVKAFGMSKEKCYPELSNIGERIMK